MAALAQGLRFSGVAVRLGCVMADFDNYAAFRKFLVIIFACGSLRVCFSLRS